MKRVFLIVLDSLGAGALPDAAEWGDEGCSTLRSIASSPKLKLDNLLKLGLGNIEGLSFLGRTEQPQAAYGRMVEASQGKDTTIGHWELSGLYSPRPLPVYPNGFPEPLLEEFSRRTGRGWLCNKPYSGTEVIKDYGEEHLKTGKLIVYTSADSVFQIAAHEQLVPPEQLYEYCRIARELLCGEHAVGRVIARPFVGEPGSFSRTANRHDFSLEPPGRTILDAVSEAGLDCIAVGKINDIFVGRGVTRAIPTHGNTEGIDIAVQLAESDFTGLCFVNLVDFDMLYGHRQDVDGYAAALSEFDARLPELLELLGEEDALLITADHGCDPGDSSTDHTREYVPLLIYSHTLPNISLGTRQRFSDVAATVAAMLGVQLETAGVNMLPPDFSREQLVSLAAEAMKGAYTPYSGFKVGAALLASDGRVFTGCNIENAAYPACNCAERTAFFKAVSEGVRDFTAIAVVGGKDGVISDICPPCGVCRQVMAEFCPPDRFRIILGKPGSYEERTLAELLPMGFGAASMK